MLTKNIYVGPFVHSKSLEELDICESGAIGVDESGKIAFIERSWTGLDDFAQKQEWESASVVSIEKQGFFFPGFIDTHIHAPQFPNAGLFGSTTLLDWLATYTFPTESRFSDLSFATQVYTRVISRLLAHGTTAAAYYATIHVPATNLLASLAFERGQRAFVGRVCMDAAAMSPAYYRDESASAALAASAESCRFIASLDPSGEMVGAVVTPRFAPSCSPEALRGLGDLARRENCRVQTHISENKDEIKLVASLFPGSASYTAVYDEAGLLGRRTILAHAVHLGAEERAIIRERGAKISHCPCSNTCLTSGAAKVKALLREGIDVGLGTDVSGGYSPSILEEVRQAILVSRHVAMVDGDEAKLSFQEALYLATRGGAKVLGLADKIGGFEVGMDWDAQLISLDVVAQDGGRLDVDTAPVDIYGTESWLDKVAKWVYSGDDRNTAAVWVRGREVHRRQATTLQKTNTPDKKVLLDG